MRMQEFNYDLDVAIGLGTPWNKIEVQLTVAFLEQLNQLVL